MLSSIGFDYTISGGIAHAKEGKPLAHLIIIEKTLIGLIHRATHLTAGASGTGSGPTGIGKINSGLLCCIEDVNVIRARKAGTTLDIDVERGHDAVDPEGLIAGSDHRCQGCGTCNVLLCICAGGAGEGTCFVQLPEALAVMLAQTESSPPVRTALIK